MDDREQHNEVLFEFSFETRLSGVSAESLRDMRMDEWRDFLSPRKSPEATARELDPAACPHCGRTAFRDDEKRGRHIRSCANHLCHGGTRAFSKCWGCSDKYYEQETGRTVSPSLEAWQVEWSHYGEGSKEHYAWERMLSFVTEGSGDPVELWAWTERYNADLELWKARGAAREYARNEAERSVRSASRNNIVLHLLSAYWMFLFASSVIRPPHTISVLYLVVAAITFVLARMGSIRRPR